MGRLRTAARRTGLLALSILTTTILLAAQEIDQESWLEDINFLEREFADRHVDLFAAVDESVYRTRFADLRRDLPDLHEYEIVCALTEIMALAEDGHTRLIHYGEPANFGYLPLRLYSFADGWFVVDATPEHTALVGREVVEIGGLEIQQAFKRLQHYVGAPSDLWARTLADAAVFVEEFMRCEGLAGEGAIDLLLRPSPGQESTHRIATIPWHERERLVLGAPRMGRPRPPDVAPRAPYWVEWIEDSSTIWVQFDAVAMDPKEPILSFAKRAVELAESLPMKRFVIDLRNNGGGNNFLPRRFADYLSESDTINQDGRLFALIGRRTFSAAINFASMLEMRTKVVFAGEPTPEAPNAFGDAELLELPHSRLRVRISSLSWQSSIVEDTRPGIDPQIPVMPTYAQFRAREDPVFDAVLLYEAEPKIEVPARTRRRLSRKLTGAYRFRGRPARILDLEGRLWLEIDAPERRSFFEVRSELVPAGAAILQTDVEGVVLRLENDRVIVDWRGTRIPLEPARN